jgi:short subunit dehydrogenase-like uncharacterized protein
MLIVYGATGYTGELIARFAAERGEKPILAGRNRDAVAQVAQRYGLPWRAFGLDDAAALDAGLQGATVMLHCAGPFSRTSKPMVDACIRSKVHYLDITGEVAVFEACAARSTEAKAAGVMLMPGVGFDVVPSDCLAAHLKRRLPSATHLALAFQGLGIMSRGTANTVVEGIGGSGLVRREGKLVEVPTAHETRRIDFGRGPTTAVAIPWGDVFTAWHSTRIPNIVVYTAVPLGLRVGMRASRLFGGLLATAPAQRFLKSRVAARPAGPTDEQRARGKSLLWGEARDASTKVQTRLEAPEGYTHTADAALHIAGRALKGDAPVGYQTPSSAYGADLVMALPGVTRTDL